MNIKWNINPLKCNDIIGTIAISECEHYLITYNHKEQRYRLWYRSNLGYIFPLLSTYYYQFDDFNDHLIYFHQFIERNSKNSVELTPDDLKEEQ